LIIRNFGVFRKLRRPQHVILLIFRTSERLVWGAESFSELGIALRRSSELGNAFLLCFWVRTSSAKCALSAWWVRARAKGHKPVPGVVATHSTCTFGCFVFCWKFTPNLRSAFFHLFGIGTWARRQRRDRNNANNSDNRYIRLCAPVISRWSVWVRRCSTPRGRQVGANACLPLYTKQSEKNPSQHERAPGNGGAFQQRVTTVAHIISGTCG
jgi:hypothetical protein